MFLSSSPDISPTDSRTTGGLRSHRKALAVLGAGDLSISSISRGFVSSPAPSPHNTTGPWSSSPMLPPSATQGTFFHDAPDYESPPPMRADSAHTGASNSPEMLYEDDGRRPSVASAATVSSQGSRSSNSGRFHKRLQGFFGEEYQGPGSESQYGIDLPNKLPGTAPRSRSKVRERNNSIHGPGQIERPSSPSISRPRTPIPSSDVTPWMYQSFNVSFASSLSCRLLAFLCCPAFLRTDFISCAAPRALIWIQSFLLLSPFFSVFIPGS